MTQAFQMMAQGYSYQEIHDALHLLRSKSSYLSMFRNRTYLGLYKLGEEEFPGPPALVDEETFAAVQARITSRQEHARRARTMGSQYLLSGLAVCGQCGAPMTGGIDRRNEERGGRPWRYYRCSQHHKLGAQTCNAPRIACDRVDQAVVNAVLDEVLTPETMQFLLNELRAQLYNPELDAAIEQEESHIASLRRAIANLTNAIETGLDEEPIRERLRQRKAELAAALKRRDEMERRRDLAKLWLTEEELLGMLREIRRKVESEDIPLARRTLAGFVEKVEVWPDHIVIHYHAPIGTGLQGFRQLPPRGFEPLSQA